MILGAFLGSSALETLMSRLATVVTEAFKPLVVAPVVSAVVAPVSVVVVVVPSEFSFLLFTGSFIAFISFLFNLPQEFSIRRIESASGVRRRQTMDDAETIIKQEVCMYIQSIRPVDTRHQLAQNALQPIPQNIRDA